VPLRRIVEHAAVGVRPCHRRWHNAGLAPNAMSNARTPARTIMMPRRIIYHSPVVWRRTVKYSCGRARQSSTNPRPANAARRRTPGDPGPIDTISRGSARMLPQISSGSTRSSGPSRSRHGLYCRSVSNLCKYGGFGSDRVSSVHAALPKRKRERRRVSDSSQRLFERSSPPDKARGIRDNPRMRK
jgi:hypothetical protein